MEGVKCYRHAEKDAIYECSSCGRLICEDCMTFTDGSDEVLCPACNVETAGAVVEEEERIRGEKRPETVRTGRVFIGRTAKSVVNPALVLLFLLLAAVAFGISWYLDTGMEPLNLANPSFERFQNPAIEMVILTSALFRYQADHNGAFPDRLSDLFPDYIDRKPTVLRSDVVYNYRTDPSDGFVLTCPQPTRYRFRRLGAGGDGVLAVQ